MATENTTEQLRFIDRFFEAFNNQTPGIEIGFDVLTALALFFTFFGYLISSAKDRKQRRNSELDKIVGTVSHHLNELERHNTQLVLHKFDSKDINNALVYLSELENYLDYKLALSGENWINEASNIMMYQKIKDMKMAIAWQKKVYIDFLTDDKTNSVEFNTEQYELNGIVFGLKDILSLFIDNNRLSFLEGMTTHNASYYSFFRKLSLSLEYQVMKFTDFLTGYFKSSGQIFFIIYIVIIGLYILMLFNDLNIPAMWIQGAIWLSVLSIARIATKRKHKKTNRLIKVVEYLYVIPFYFLNIDIIQIFKDLF
jgi:hypothetical protein